MSAMEENINDILLRYNQNNIIRFLDMCNDIQKEKLINQLKSINFDQVLSLYKISKNLNENKVSSQNEIKPVKAIDKYNIRKDKSLELKEIGEKVIKSNEYAVATMAGRSRN